MTETITMTRGNYLSLRKAHDAAIASGLGPDATFEWNGHIMLISYSKYLLEYLSTIPGIGKP
jgi:hypothetical protein